MPWGTHTRRLSNDLAGNRTSLTHPNNASITYTYLHNNWLATITHRRGDGTLIETITYGYDQNGNRTTLTDYTGSTVFGYDQLNRLTSAAYPGTYGTWAWTYDQVGNRITQNSPSGQTNYSYDANNRLTSATGKTYTYDSNGNLTGVSDGASFGYDAHNRMSQANLPGGLTVQYTYNGDGLKIRRIEGSAVTRYYHDGIRPIYETDSAGSLKAQLERDIFGNLLARQDSGGARYYYHHDGLGSTVGLTNASGQLVAQRTYDAWGNRRTSSGSAPGNYQFTGAELDPTSGLYHMGARFYDPTIGRWLQEDPVQDRQFEPETLNFYAYAADNPVRFIDPKGTSVQDLVKEWLKKGWDYALQQLKELYAKMVEVVGVLNDLGIDPTTLAIGVVSSIAVALAFQTGNSGGPNLPSVTSPLGKLIGEWLANPGEWIPISTYGAATGRAYSGAVSFKLVYLRLRDGAVFGYHLIARDGAVLHQHFRQGGLRELLRWLFQ